MIYIRFCHLKVNYLGMIYGSRYSRMIQVKFVEGSLKGCLPQILLGRFLNMMKVNYADEVLSYIILAQCSISNPPPLNTFSGGIEMEHWAKLA